jgi:hypothetical protein
VRNTLLVLAFVFSGPMSGNAALATEIALEFDEQPVFATVGPGAIDIDFARYAVDDVEVEIHALGDGFGYVLTGPDPAPDENVASGVSADGDIECGNQDNCNPFVATFSIALDAVGVDFIGVGNFAGGGAIIFSSGFFLDAWSGPDATGTLLASVADPGGAAVTPLPGGGYLLPASLSLVASGIRSIVFGATAITDEYVDPVNLSIVDRIRMIPVPEPATAGMVALGLIALSARGRARNQARAAAIH